MVNSEYLDSSFRAFSLEVIVLHDLGHDETFLKVCVNPSGSLRSLCTSLHLQ